MPKFNTTCSDCGSPLMVPDDAHIDYPMHSSYERGHLKIRLVCAEGCGYDCFHSFVFVSRVDAANPTFSKSDRADLMHRIEEVNFH